MAQLIHSSNLYKPAGIIALKMRRDAPPTVKKLRSLSFLNTDHPAVDLMWTPRDVLEKLKTADKRRYTNKILEGSKSYFNETVHMTRFWN